MRNLAALSIWEIAHRWHGFDPNVTNIKELPLDIQDKLRFLTLELAYLRYPLANSKGIEMKCEDYLPSFEEFIVPEYMSSSARVGDDDSMAVIEIFEEDNDELNESERREIYSNWCDKVLSKQVEATENYSQCYKDRVYDKNLLSDHYITKWTFKKMCVDNGLDIPEFWFDLDAVEPFDSGQSADSQTENKKLRPNQLAREKCRVAAQTLWHIYPNMTIREMEERKEILEFGGGAHFQGKNTIRDWIKDLQPNKKPGRPKKTPFKD